MAPTHRRSSRFMMMASCNVCVCVCVGYVNFQLDSYHVTQLLRPASVQTWAMPRQTERSPVSFQYR